MNIIQFAIKSFSFSPFRALEYEEIQKNALSGRVLDLGGGGVATYSKLFKGKYKIVSINIDPAVKPTVVGDITKEFPFKDEEFDAVISFNTFEHIPEFEKTFSEAFRVLKKGGKFIFATPFLHQVHGSPNDYWRYSASALENLLKKNGFNVEKIMPLGKGIFVARYSLLYGAIPRILCPMFSTGAWLGDAFWTAISSRYRNSCTADNYPLGYFAVAEK